MSLALLLLPGLLIVVIGAVVIAGIAYRIDRTMPALITPTRIGLGRRLSLSVRAWYLRQLLSSAQADVEHHTRMAQVEPMRAQLARSRCAELRVQLMDCELGGGPAVRTQPTKEIA